MHSVVKIKKKKKNPEKLNALCVYLTDPSWKAKIASLKNIKREHEKYQPGNSYIQNGISLNKHTHAHTV